MKQEHFAKVTSTFLNSANLQNLIPLLVNLGWKLLFQMRDFVKNKKSADKVLNACMISHIMEKVL